MGRRWISTKEAFDLVSAEYEKIGRYADEEVVFRVAEEALLKRLRYGALDSYAALCQIIDEPFSADEKRTELSDHVIPARFWRALDLTEPNGRELDWVSGDFSFEDDSSLFEIRGVAFNVRLDADNLPGLGNTNPADSQASLTLPDQNAGHAPTGRRPKWDWEGAIAHIVAIANQVDGLEGLSNGPFRQADVEREISEWFVGHFGEAPATSEVRKRASKIMAALAEAEN